MPSSFLFLNFTITKFKRNIALLCAIKKIYYELEIGIIFTLVTFQHFSVSISLRYLCFSGKIFILKVHSNNLFVYLRIPTSLELVQF